MADNIMEKIDEIATVFNQTHDKKYFEQFVKCATPLIKRHISKTCAGSNWDTDDLFSILIIDMWRLFNRWVPENGKKFHWLMLRQLQNKTINYIHGQMGRPHKICPTCGVRQEDQPSYTCRECNSSLRVSDIVVSEAFDYSTSHFPDYLSEIANKQLVNQLLNEVKDDPKTHKILTMLLNGDSKTEISSEVKIAQNALNNRLKKCQKIIHKLMRNT